MAKRDETYLLYTFNSPHSAIKTQKILNDLKPKLIPVLRELSESCGMAVKIIPEYLEDSIKIMDKSNIAKWALYKVTVLNGKTVIEKVQSKEDV